jgi:hypothetical protein
MTDVKTVQYYTFDLLRDLLDKARKAKSKYRETRSEFDSGYSMAYYEVISMAVNRAEAFSLSLADVGLEDVPDPDVLLEDV